MTVIFLLVTLAVVKIAIKQHSVKEFNFDQSTTLLLKQREIRRSRISKPEMLAQLAKLELDIENHLNNVEVETANELAKLNTKLFS